MRRFSRTWPWWRCGMLGLISIALSLSAYLSWHFLSGEAVIGCGGGSACDDVLNSRWSSVGNALPVSGLAAGAYLAMLVASFSLGPDTVLGVRRLAWRATLVLAGAIAGSAIWFTIVQKWIVGAFCPYCMTAHIAGLLLAILVISRASKEIDERSDVRVIGRWPAIGFSSMGLALAAALAVCQWKIAPRSVYRSGEAQNSADSFNAHDVSLVGSPDASYVVKMLFDYKCPHCQQLHFMLGEAVRRYQGKLAFALYPTPMRRECNPYIPRDVDEFKDSCELARIGLTVWVAKREASPGFDDWMFSHESGDRWQPRSLEAAKAKAIELVGQAKFDSAFKDPQVDRYLQTAIQLYGTAGGGAIPKLIFGSHWVTPKPNDAEDLVAILHDSLALPVP